MTFEPATSAGPETRTILTGNRDGLVTKIAVARRTYPTAQADLWDALTNPERIPRWFLPFSGEFKPGSRYQFEGNAGGVVEACEAPSRFAMTWEMQGMVSWIEVLLSADGDGTALELRHEAPFNEEFWAQFGPGAVGVGWDLALMGLGIHLQTGAAVDPAAAEAWTVGPEGISYVRAAATGWADAAVADGDDASSAHEAAERTVAFYTTIPDDVPGR